MDSIINLISHYDSGVQLDLHAKSLVTESTCFLAYMLSESAISAQCSPYGKLGSEFR